MKTETSILQFTGYPLRVVEDNVNYADSSSKLSVAMKKDLHKKAPKDKVAHKPADNPLNWDDAWFSNYE
jgi:hypothetical protein